MKPDITFEQFLKELDKLHIKYVKVKGKEWEIFLPYAKKTAVQDIIVLCRRLRCTTWHVVYPEPTESKPEPETRMYWEPNDQTNAAQDESGNVSQLRTQQAEDA